MEFRIGIITTAHPVKMIFEAAVIVQDDMGVLGKVIEENLSDKRPQGLLPNEIFFVERVE